VVGSGGWVRTLHSAVCEVLADGCSYAAAQQQGLPEPAVVAWMVVVAGAGVAVITVGVTVEA